MMGSPSHHGYCMNMDGPCECTLKSSFAKLDCVHWVRPVYDQNVLDLAQMVLDKRDLNPKTIEEIVEAGSAFICDTSLDLPVRHVFTVDAELYYRMVKVIGELASLRSYDPNKKLGNSRSCLTMNVPRELVDELKALDGELNADDRTR